MAKQRRRNEEMEREGAVALDCWMRGVCTAPLAELSLAGFTNTWNCYSFPKRFYFASHITKNNPKTSHNVFQMLFLTCSLCIKANHSPAFSSANQNWKTVGNSPANTEFNVSKHLQSCLPFCPGTNSSRPGYNNISCWYFYHFSASSVTVLHTLHRGNIFWQQNHPSWQLKLFITSDGNWKTETGTCIWATSILGY